MCFNTFNFSIEEWNATFSQIDESDKDVLKEVKKHSKEFMISLKNAPFYTEALTNVHHVDIEKIFDKYFKEYGKVSYHLGNDNSNLYITSLKGYSHNVVKAIEAVYNMFQMENILNTFSEDAIKSMMLAGAKT